MHRRVWKGLLLTVLLGTSCAQAAAPPGPAPRAPTARERERYPWLSARHLIRPLAEVLPPPEGYTRVTLEEDSFGAWLRGLPLRPAGTPVLDFRGQRVLSSSSPALTAVAELDVGSGDLQQCADSLIRLHAEWLWSRGERARIAYRFTSGHLASWERYAQGERPRVSGAKVTWVKSAPEADSRAAFRAYLDMVFTYAGTLSLAAGPQRPPRADVRPGDFFVLGGSPGHTVMVLDVARDERGRRVALIGQGFTPAQDFHVLSPPGGDGPWFSLEEDTVATPSWTPFPWSSLRRW